MYVCMCNFINHSQKHCSDLKSRFPMFVHFMLCFFVCKMPEALDLDLSGCLEAGSDVGDLESSADFGGFNERQVAASCTKYCRRIIDLITLLNLVLWAEHG